MNDSMSVWDRLDDQLHAWRLEQAHIVETLRRTTGRYHKVWVEEHGLLATCTRDGTEVAARTGADLINRVCDAG